MNPAQLGPPPDGGSTLHRSPGVRDPLRGARQAPQHGAAAQRGPAADVLPDRVLWGLGRPPIRRAVVPGLPADQLHRRPPSLGADRRRVLLCIPGHPRPVDWLCALRCIRHSSHAVPQASRRSALLLTRGGKGPRQLCWMCAPRPGAHTWGRATGQLRHHHEATTSHPRLHAGCSTRRPPLPP